MSFSLEDFALRSDLRDFFEAGNDPSLGGFGPFSFVEDSK